MGTNDDDIGQITLAQETTLLYFEETSRLMSHQLYHPLDGKHALVYQFEHGDQGELNHRHARGSLGATSLLVFPLMGSMVGTYGGDSAVSQSLAQCRAVGQGLDGRVALDERLLGSIIRLGEIEVGNDSLARHRGTWRKEVELAATIKRVTKRKRLLTDRFSLNFIGFYIVIYCYSLHPQTLQ